MLPEGLAIRELATSDAAALADAYLRNSEHLAPFEPARTRGYFTEEGQERAIADQLARARQGLTAAWVLVGDDRIVGRITLNNIVMGVLRSASIGYWVDAEHLRRGLATAAVGFACTQAQERGLHRLEAGTLLHNTASQRVLERSGFEVYGLARSYLFIGGAWRDHRLFQRILNDDPL